MVARQRKGRHLQNFALMKPPSSTDQVMGSQRHSHTRKQGIDNKHMHIYTHLDFLNVVSEIHAFMKTLVKSVSISFK